jgi:transposase InsO family protein
MGRKVDWDKIGEVVDKIKEHSLSFREGARQFGINERTIYDYNFRIKKKGEADKRGEVDNIKENKESTFPDEEKREEKQGGNLPEDIKEIIVAYRKEHPDHGYKRIEDHLKSRYFVVVSRKKIREILKAHGINETCPSSFDRNDERSRKGSRRFEAGYPRDLYQMDVSYVYLSGIPVLYLIVIVDDYSRFCISAELRHDQKGSTMIEVLHQSIERYGKPRRLMTDQGSSFYTWSHEQTQFQRYLDEMGIEHIVTDPHSPQTNGKVERLHQTIQREVLQKVRFGSFQEAQRGICDYQNSYNYDRPHQGINGARPYERFHGITGEVSRLETELSSKAVDFSKGYLVLKTCEHTISVVNSSKGIRIYLNGELLQRR